MNRYTLSHIPICPYCDTIATYTSSERLFGKDHGMIYLCGFCKAYVGCHPNTNIPLGTMANKELRQLRLRCHELFDPIWKTGTKRRANAYRWLSSQLDIPFQETHFGMFNEEQCLKSIKIFTTHPIFLGLQSSQT